MKTFKKTYLPDSVEYKGSTYVLDVHLSNELNYGDKTKETLDYFYNCVIVEVLSKNLKGKVDLGGKPYKPTVHVFVKQYGKFEPNGTKEDKSIGILHFNNGYYVSKQNGFFEVIMPLDSVSSIVDSTYDEISLAVARCNYLAKKV